MPDPDSPKLKIHQKFGALESLIFKFGNLGLVAIEPGPLPRREIPYTDFLLFPRPIDDSLAAAAHLWVEARECPIFCVRKDFEAFSTAGFGPHKFNIVEGYREISVEGGSITFIPAAHEKTHGLRGILTEFFDAWGMRAKKAFHLKLKSRNQPPVLFLANPLIDSLDSKILCEESPSRIIALGGYPEAEWARVSQFFSVPIEPAHRIIKELKTNPLHLSPDFGPDEQTV